MIRNKNSSQHNSSGFSLLEMIVAIAIFSLISVSVTTLISEQNRQIKNMSQKIAVNDLKNALLSVMQNAAACRNNLDSALNPALVFDSTAANPAIVIPRIRVGDSPTSTILTEPNQEIGNGTRLFTQNIFLANLMDIGGGKWSGVWTVTIRNDFSQFAFRPITLNPQVFDVDTTVPNAAKITSCNGIGGGGSYWTSLNGTDIFFNTIGRVGIGTSTPRGKLDVSGGQAVGAFHNAGAATTLDFDNGNMQTTSAAAGTITLSNIQSGGSYTIILSNAAGGVFTLSSGGSHTFRCQPDCPSSEVIVNAGTHTVITIIATNTVAYVAWMRAF